MIRARGLGGTAAGGVELEAVDLSLEPGTVWGLLGPTRADRGLLLQLLGAVLRPERGRATVLGRDVEREAVAVRRRAAFLPGEKDALPALRAGEFLRFYLGFFPGADRPEDVLAVAGLDAGLRLRDASPAERSRLLLAAVMGRRAELLLLDEPTADLDPAAAERALSELVAGAGPEGHGVVLASSRIEEVQRVCDRVGVLVDGRLILDAPLSDLLERWCRVWVAANLRSARELARLPSGRITRRRPDGIEIVTDDFAALRPELEGAPGVRVQPMSLREIYLEVVARVA